MPNRPQVFVGLGSNLGDREAALAFAISSLASRGFRVLLASSVYATEPVGGPPQPFFLNQVVAGETELSPEALLAAALAIEEGFGRRRTVPLAPRTLDIDLLLYADELRQTPALILPHPRMHRRRFVLVPLAEIAPWARHPTLGRTAAELLRDCPDHSEVQLHRAVHDLASYRRG